MTTVHWISLILVIIGAINWGLVGLFQFDLVAAIFGGEAAPLARVLYTLVGIAGVVLAVTSTQREPTLHQPRTPTQTRA
jgi:uncharacterized membrane protein YuzA (DUF378 family)